ncbi:MAG: nucleoside-triphosphatase [Desulfurococcales archaeon]|jgi:nucleoside-triphosphatase|nr:nucleoside-triphosphatase [Desulfurococcaceae archaeon]MCC6061271.1 nucleoside-triphosphatase [Desulfurococcaceae archaeon]MDT7866777.1 nucleoside-triphosphatase [Desulfurococcales archaeon]
MGGWGFYITGAPGVGKSTVFMKVVDELRKLGCSVGGMYAPEVRMGGVRVGFMIVDLDSGARGWLARVGDFRGPRVGKYVVVVDDVLRVGVPALERALAGSNVIAIDEIGPMELAVPRLRSSIIRCIESGKLYLAVVHRGLSGRDPEVFKLISTRGSIVEVTLENRGRLLASAVEIARRISNEACPGG